MRSRFRLASLPLLLALLAPSLAGVGSAAPRAEISVRDGLTQPVFSYEEAVRETVYVQSKLDQDADGDLDLLATDIIRPKETEQGLKVPVIYEMSPYYQALGRGNEAEIKQEEDGDFQPGFFPLYYDNYFVPRGYAVVLQDMRGTRNSEGCMVLGADEEELDAVATIDWLNGRGKAFTATGEEVKAAWSTGKVGMIGKSYDGSVANGAASTGVKGLKTIVPIGAISRWYDYHLNKGVQYVNAYTTPALFSFYIDQTPADDEERQAEWVEATFGESGPCSAEGTAIVAQAADPRSDYNEFWDERDYLKDASNVRASVLIAHGLNDWNVKPNNYVQWWKALARNEVPRKIWLAQTGHVDPFEFRRKRWVRTLHRWFDRWLHGIRNGIMAEPVADIERAADKWKTYGSWPAERARRVRLYLREGRGKRPGTFGRRRAVPQQTQTFTDDPQQFESRMVEQPMQTSDSRLVFLTKRLKRSVRLSGRVDVKIRAVVDRADTNFTALLVDYGKARRVDHEGPGEGVEILDSESCHGASTEQDDACYFVAKKRTHVAPYEIVSRGWLDARHRRSLRSSSLLIPGESYRFGWHVFGDDYVFKKGHRIGIVIAASDFDWTVPEPEPATIDVDLRRSRVYLPIVGGFRRLRL
ncbi:MAG TPA: Xaa-Pro dipeptidyl-peptidase [Actinomycetota bacterium]|nr:Xaa-Pro dipeptidyl-peptidase [Actinomycetota bacterium]